MPDKNGWTRVEDGLPEDGEQVYARFAVSKVYEERGFKARPFPDMRTVAITWPPAFKIAFVTHWQPQQYPDPPEDE